jgi:hypothetical protein
MLRVEVQKQAMLQALEKTLGVVTSACKAADIPRSTHYDWMKSDPEYAAKVEDIHDIALDFAESQLHKQISNGEISSTIFYLKTKGKKRGYIEKTESEVYGKDGKPIVTETHVKIIRDKRSGTTPVNSASESAEGD